MKRKRQLSVLNVDEFIKSLIHQILLAGDLDLIKKGVWGTLKKRHGRKRKKDKGVDKVF